MARRWLRALLKERAYGRGIRVDVRWCDTNALGHVNHAVFVTYRQESRDAFYALMLGIHPVYVVVRLEVEPIPFSEIERAPAWRQP
ncbi:MAG TPA: hypothetical protein VGI66_08450 [Streptosporangiaceae bacterium]|jgi:hypothetical protein